jgi:tetratricopeptide (TPR) repeat protein
LPQDATGEIDPALLSGLSPLMDEVDTLLLQERWEELYDAIDLRLEADPDDVEALTVRSMIATFDGDIEQGVADAERVIELAPDSHLGYVALSEAQLNWAINDPEAGLAAAQQALERAPGNREALWRVAQANAELNNPAAARLSLQRAETNGASGFRFAYFAGTNLYYDGLYGRAAPYLATWYQADPSSYSMSLAAGALIHLGSFDAAYDLVKAYPREMVEAPELWTAAYVAYRAGDFEQAREWALTARAISDEAYPATYVLALLSWYGEENLEAALAYFESLEGVEFYDELISQDYGHDLYMDKGRILAAAGQHREAIAAYEQSFEVNGEFPQGYLLMADSYMELGEPDTALAKLRFALELTDEPLQQRRLLARIRELAGE